MHEVALEAAGPADRAQADGKQGHGAGDGQGDPGGGLRCPALRGGGDDSDEAGGEELGGRGRARRGAVACNILLIGTTHLLWTEDYTIKLHWISVTFNDKRSKS